MGQKNLNIRLCILQGVFWSSFCVLFSFLVPLLKSWGYNNFVIGTLTMLMAFSSTIAQPLWGTFCDKKGHIKLLFVFLMSISCLLAITLPLGARSVILCAIAIILLSATAQSMPALIDSWAVRLINDGEKVNYAFTRGFGSLFFAFIAMGFGRLLDKYGMRIIIPAFLALASIAILVAITTKSPSPTKLHLLEVETKGSFHTLLKNKEYLVFIISVLLVYIGNGATMVFYPVLISSLGGGNSELGTGLFIMALSEVPTMLLFVFISRRVSNIRSLMFSMFFFGVKGILLALSPNVTWAIIAQVFQALSFGLFLPSAVNYINKIVEEKVVVSAQLVFSSAAFGIGAIIGNFSGGVLSELFGVKVMMLILNSVTFSGFVVFTVYHIYKNKNRSTVYVQNKNK